MRKKNENSEINDVARCTQHSLSIKPQMEFVKNQQRMANVFTKLAKSIVVKQYLAIEEILLLSQEYLSNRNSSSFNIL